MPKQSAENLGSSLSLSLSFIRRRTKVSRGLIFSLFKVDEKQHERGENHVNGNRKEGNHLIVGDLNNGKVYKRRDPAENITHKAVQSYELRLLFCWNNLP